MLKEIKISGSYKDTPVDVMVNAPVKGRLAYTYIKQPIVGDSFLVLHNLEEKVAGSANQAKANLSSTTMVYAWQKSVETAGSEIYAPMWSPDGRYVLFKFGSPEAILDSYQLYVLDSRTNNLKRVSARRLANSEVMWSPDSRYIAFIDNGDGNGNTTLAPVGDYIGPLELYVCNWRTGKEYHVTNDDMLIGPFSWIAPHSLLYSALPPAQVKNKSHNEKPEVMAGRPNIYEYSLGTGTSKLLIKDGYFPNVSPDNQRLAFFGSENTARPMPLRGDWQDKPRGAALSVANTDGTGRMALNRENNSYPSVYWAQDKYHLITIHQLNNTSAATGVIKEWNIQTSHFRQIAALRANISKSVDMPYNFSNFTALNSSKDGKSLFVFVTELLGILPDNSAYRSRVTLQSIDLKTGAITTIARLNDTTGEGWYDNSASVH